MHIEFVRELRRVIREIVHRDAIVLVDVAVGPRTETLLVEGPESRNVTDFVAHDATSVTFSYLRNDPDDPCIWGVDIHPLGATFCLYWVPGAIVVHGFVRENVDLQQLRAALCSAKQLGTVRLITD